MSQKMFTEKLSHTCRRLFTVFTNQEHSPSQLNDPCCTVHNHVKICWRVLCMNRKEKEAFVNSMWG